MKKATHQTDRGSVSRFQQIINVGPATEKDFLLLGLTSPRQLAGRDPWELYYKLCQLTKTRHDPCVLDVFMACIDFMNGNPPRKWWDYTEERKRRYADRFGFSIG